MLDENSAPSGDWTRTGFTAGGGDAYLLYAVWGDFAQPITFSEADYRTRGIPAGVTLEAYSRADHAAFLAGIYAGLPGRILASEHAALLSVVENAPVCLIVQGTVADPPTLDYLRDVVGVLTSLLDKGGAALLDWQTLRWFAPQEWRESVFVPNAPVPLRHAVVFLSPENGSEEGSEEGLVEGLEERSEEGAAEGETDTNESTDKVTDKETGKETKRLWVHTRGMRKFGRPDLSLRHVAPEYQDACIELCHRFIALQAFGDQVPEGQPVRMRGLPPGITCHHRGDYDDPDFNNVHIEMRLTA